MKIIGKYQEIYDFQFGQNLSPLKGNKMLEILQVKLSVLVKMSLKRMVFPKYKSHIIKENEMTNRTGICSRVLEIL